MKLESGTPDHVSSSGSEQESSRQSSTATSPSLPGRTSSGSKYFSRKRASSIRQEEQSQSDEAISKAQHEMFDLNEKALQESFINRGILLKTLKEALPLGRLSMVSSVSVGSDKTALVVRMTHKL